MTWYNEYMQFVRGSVRPLAIIMLVATLCTAVLMEQVGYKATPWWFTSGVGLALIEWIFERAVGKRGSKQPITQQVEKPI